MKKIYSSPFVKLYSEDFKYKKKFYKNFHKIILKDASVVILQKDNKILITQEYRRGVKKKLHGLPGGHIDRGETPLQTAKRELKEETGLEAKNWKLLTSYISSGTYYCNKEYIFKAEYNKKSKSVYNSEIESLFWVNDIKLLKILKKHLNTSGFISAISLYLLQKKEKK